MWLLEATAPIVSLDTVATAQRDLEDSASLADPQPDEKRVLLSALLKLSQESKEPAAPVIPGGRKQAELLESSPWEDSYTHALIKPGSRPGWTGPEIEPDAVWTLVIQNGWLIKGLFNFEIVVAFQVRCKGGGLWGLLGFPALTSAKQGSSVQESTPHPSPEWRIASLF